jgi:hypothetical protein
MAFVPHLLAGLALALGLVSFGTSRWSWWIGPVADGETAWLPVGMGKLFPDARASKDTPVYSAGQRPYGSSTVPPGSPWLQRRLP